MSTVVSCTETDASVQFYCAHLDYFRTTYLYGEGWALLEASSNSLEIAGSYLMLVASSEPNHRGCNELIIYVDDVDCEHQRLRSLQSTGIALAVGDMVEYPLARYFCVADPSGNTVQVEENTGLMREIELALSTRGASPK